MRRLWKRKGKTNVKIWFGKKLWRSYETLLCFFTAKVMGIFKITQINNRKWVIKSLHMRINGSIKLFEGKTFHKVEQSFKSLKFNFLICNVPSLFPSKRFLNPFKNSSNLEVFSLKTSYVTYTDGLIARNWVKGF